MFVSEVEFMLHKKQLNRIIKIQELKLKLLEKEIKINKIDTRIQLTAMAAILKPSEMSNTDFVLKISGTLKGIERGRHFCQNDAHLFCTPEQIKSEVADVCNLIFETYKDFNITDYRCVLSLRAAGNFHNNCCDG